MPELINPLILHHFLNFIFFPNTNIWKIEKTKKILLILFFFNKMAPKTLDGSAFSFTTTRGHTTHISILWVFVLFSFLTVSVVLLGGYQEGLVERKFTNAKVTDKMDVTQALQVNKAGNPGFYTGMATAAPAAAPAVALASNTAYMINYQGNEGANTVLTLPEATVGNKVVVGLRNDIAAATNFLAIQCGTGDAFETGSLVPTAGAGGVAAPISFDTSDEGETTLTYTPGIDNNSTLLTLGSEFYFYCTNKGRWHVHVSAATGPSDVNLNASTGTLLFS